MEKRSRGPVLSEDELMKTCHHEIQNLQIIVDLWWCTKDYLGGPKWLERAKGCVFCGFHLNGFDFNSKHLTLNRLFFSFS
jgi:hypothetical protein